MVRLDVIVLFQLREMIGFRGESEAQDGTLIGSFQDWNFQFEVSRVLGAILV